MAKKTSKKKPAAKKAAAPAPKVTGTSKPRTKGEFYKTIAENVGLKRTEVARVFDVVGAILEKDLSSKGPGVVNVAGMMKVTVKRMPATKAREGINPFTGEKTMFKAKPARNVVKIRPLKALKSMV